jgi:hypothetical protein
MSAREEIAHEPRVSQKCAHDAAEAAHVLLESVASFKAETKLETG